MRWTASINHWAMPGLSVREAATLARQAAFGAIELNLDETGEVSLATDERNARALRAVVADEGLAISGLATGLYWRYSPTADDPATRRRALEIARRQLALAAALEAGAILVVPGQVGTALSEATARYDLAWDRAVEFLAALAPEAASTGVDIAIENVWNKFLLSPLEMQRIVDGTGSDRVGVYFDVGNILLYGYPEQWIEILGRRIRRVHLKDFRRAVGTLDGFVAIGSGDVNWATVGAALRQIDYHGPLTAEVFPDERQRADLPAYVAAVGRQVAGAIERMAAPA